MSPRPRKNWLFGRTYLFVAIPSSQSHHGGVDLGPRRCGRKVRHLTQAVAVIMSEVGKCECMCMGVSIHKGLNRLCPIVYQVRCVCESDVVYCIYSKSHDRAKSGEMPT